MLTFANVTDVSTSTGFGFFVTYWSSMSVHTHTENESVVYIGTATQAWLLNPELMIRDASWPS